MKLTLCLLPFLLLGLTACKQQGIDAEHQKKTEQIIERVASGKPLPAGLFWNENFRKNAPPVLTVYIML